MYLEKIENSGGKLAKYEGCGSFIEKNRKFYESGNFGQLSKVDQKIFRDSTLLLVSECTDERKRIDNFSKVLNGVCLETGLKMPDVRDAGSIFYAVCDVIDMYFDDLSFNEIRLAWRLLAVGELDPFLPKDRYGSPDKNHYGSLSVDYISKVLKAYKKRKIETMERVSQIMPDEKPKPTPEQEKMFLNLQAYNFVLALLKYKYSGRFRIERDRIINESTFAYMERLGYDMSVVPTLADKKEALFQFQGRPVNSFAQIFEKECISKFGIDHEAVYFRAVLISKKRKLFQYWDEMLAFSNEGDRSEDNIWKLYYYIQ